MKQMLLVLALIFSSELYSAKIKQTTKLKSYSLSKIKRSISVAEKLTKDTKEYFLSWGFKVIKKSKSESTISLIQSAVRQAYPARGLDVMVDHLKTIKALRQELKRQKRDFFDLSRNELLKSKKLKDTILGSFFNYVKTISKPNRSLRYYSVMTVKEESAADGIAIVDIKSKEVLFIDMIFKE